jgi:hypothetical protein
VDGEAQLLVRTEEAEERDHKWFKDDTLLLLTKVPVVEPVEVWAMGTDEGVFLLRQEMETHHL